MIKLGGRGAFHTNRNSGTLYSPVLLLNFLASTSLDSRITFSRGSNATLTDSTGKITYAPANLLLNTATLSTQSVTTQAISYILSFKGTGSVALSGAYTGSLAGTGATDRVYLKFTSTAASLTLTVTGTVTEAQLEPVTYQTTPSTYQATTSTAYYGPRFDYDPVTLAAKGLLVEEQRTNLFTYSADITNAAWSKNNTTTTADATTAPDGTTTADKLAETATTAVHNAGQSITTTAQAYTFYCYIKAAERNFALLYHTQSNASVSVNLTTGATGTASGTVAPTSSSVTSVGNGWWRVAMTVTATAASNFFGVYVMNDLVNASYAGTAGSGIYVWGAQLEAGSFATSYIPTVASTVTRSADVATMTGANFSSWYNSTAGTLVVSASQPTIFASSRTASAFSYSGTGSRVGIYRQSAGPINGFVTPGAGALLSGVNATANTVWKGAIAYDTTTGNVSVNGSAVATGAHTASLTLFDNFGIGGYASGNENFCGHIRTLTYYNTRLPNSTLVSLTS